MYDCYDANTYVYDRHLQLCVDCVLLHTFSLFVLLFSFVCVHVSTCLIMFCLLFVQSVLFFLCVCLLESLCAFVYFGTQLLRHCTH